VHFISMTVGGTGVMSGKHGASYILTGSPTMISIFAH